MAFLTWSDEYSLGIVSIDAQHKRLFDMVNDLHEAMRGGKANDVLGRILDNLVSYTKLHFAHEEKIMGETAYADLAAHRKQHDDLTKKAVELQQRFRAGNGLISIEVMRFLKEWLVNHIQGTDRKYCDHLKAHKVA